MIGQPADTAANAVLACSPGRQLDAVVVVAWTVDAEGTEYLDVFTSDGSSAPLSIGVTGRMLADAISVVLASDADLLDDLGVDDDE